VSSSIDGEGVLSQQNGEVHRPTSFFFCFLLLDLVLLTRVAN